MNLCLCLCLCLCLRERGAERPYETGKVQFVLLGIEKERKTSSRGFDGYGHTAAEKMQTMMNPHIMVMYSPPPKMWGEGGDM